MATTGGGPPPRKMNKLDAPPKSDSEDDGQEIDEETQLQSALQEIDASQNEIDSLNEKASNEINKVKQKYNKLKKPFFEKRNTVIAKVKNFWATAMVNHRNISPLIDKEEMDCLHFLKKLEVEEFEDIESGFRIKFYFDDNPYFEEDCLVKEFHMSIITLDITSTNTEIRWKTGMDLSKFKENETLRRQLGFEPKNFFTWFLNYTTPSDDTTAEAIKDDLWSDPVKYYLIGDMGDDLEKEGSDEDDDDDAVVIDEEDDEIHNDENDNPEDDDDDEQ